MDIDQKKKIIELLESEKRVIAILDGVKEEPIIGFVDRPNYDQEFAFGRKHDCKKALKVYQELFRGAVRQKKQKSITDYLSD